MYTVEAIIDRRDSSTKRKSAYQYLVKWEGWDIADSTWQPQSNLTNIKNLLRQFDKNYEIKSIKLSESKKNTDSQKIYAIEDHQEKKDFQKSDGRMKKRKVIQKSRKKECSKNRNKSILIEHCEQKQNIAPMINVDSSSENDQQKKQQENVINDNRAQKNESKDEVKNVRVLGMKKEKGNFSFYLNEDGIENWKTHEYVISHYPAKLCEFYEMRIVFS